MLDLRYPMGLMFALVGAMLTVYGVFTNSSGMEPAQGDKPAGMYLLHSLGLNVNLYWGVALMGFGLLVFGLARWSAAAEKRRAEMAESADKAKSRLG
jgi:hypothetical protein